MPRKLTVRVQQLEALKPCHRRDSINQGTYGLVKDCPHRPDGVWGGPLSLTGTETPHGVTSQAPP